MLVCLHEQTEYNMFSMWLSILCNDVHICKNVTSIEYATFHIVDTSRPTKLVPCIMILDLCWHIYIISLFSNV